LTPAIWFIIAPAKWGMVPIDEHLRIANVDNVHKPPMVK
jgi:hypothetical protein